MNNEKHLKPLILQHTFLASENTLFDAWVTPPVAELWMYQFKENPVNFFADVTEGGAFHTEEKKDRNIISHFGKYILIERPHKLVFTLSVHGVFEGESEITINIKQSEQGGSNLLFTQRNVDTSKNSKPWQNMFASLEKLLVQPYMVTDNSDVQQLVEAINITVMQIAGFFLSLNNKQINKVPFTNSWTPAQLLRHITKSMSGLGEFFGKEVKAAERNPHEKILPLKQTFLDITQTLQSPEFIVPEEKEYNKEVVLNDLYKCLYALNHVADNIDEKGLITRLPMGDVTKLELLHFICYHSQRHLIQIKKIVSFV